MWWTRERRRAKAVAGRVQPRERWPGAQDERRLSVRQNRVVLTPRCWRQVCGFNLQMTVTNKPDRRGERCISRKAITQGMPDASAEPVCSCAHPLPPLRTRPRVQRASGIPCALRFSRANYMQDSGASRCEKAESRSPVVMPRFKRGIQYAVMSRTGTTVSGIRDRPVICS